MSENRYDFIPPAWNYNPSAWSQRVPLAIVASIGFLIALYMGLYQVGVFSNVWDPFFGDGTKRVLTSSVSKAFPIPDALFGALAYAMDIALDLFGKEDRWKTMPWIVILFGIAVGPLGATSILLVILQPVVAGAWCALCLTSALISVIMISPATDELLASLQYLQRVRRSGHSVWKAFWGNQSVISKVD
jgi:uncharacterized membrane protein